MQEKIEKSKYMRAQIETYLREHGNGYPITERPNEITTNIDLTESGEQIVRLLAQTDKEIFDGWKLKDSTLKSEGLKHDFFILDKLDRLADKIRHKLSNGDDGKKLKIVLSGCGTSGRIAYLCAKTFNSFVGKDICEYIIAGGDFALVNSVEAVEDKPEVGEKELTKIIDENDNIECIYIGITCGLSAPFVGGQLSYCIDELTRFLEANNEKSKIIGCCLIGFNPMESARQTQPVDRNRTQTFRDLALKLSSLERTRPDVFFVLNPLIGPEPITGSSRMKSGTATKIMIDIILTRALMRTHEAAVSIENMIEWYERVMNEVVYANEAMLGYVIDRAANSLRHLGPVGGGSINYLADSERIGFLACVDASECVPTYGAHKDDIKGFVSASNGLSLSSLERRDSRWSSFIQTCHSVQSENILNKIDMFKSENCSFIVIKVDDEIESSNPNFPTSSKIKDRLLSDTNAEIIQLNLGLSAEEIVPSERIKPIEFGIRLRPIMASCSTEINPYFSQCLEEFALKLVLNGSSTGAHVLIGKTYENIMVDVRVSNIKLFYRALGILKRLTNEPDERCKQSLLTAIYGEDLSGVDDLNIERHVEMATSKVLIVPKALVMLLTKCSLQKTQEYLSQSHNSVRNCIFKLKNKQ